MVDQAADRAHRAARGKLGRLDVGVYGSAIFGIVPNILARFSRENPDVEIALYYAQTPQQVSALRQGRVRTFRKKQKALRGAPYHDCRGLCGPPQAIEYPAPLRRPPLRCRASSARITMPKPTKQTNDQLAIEPPKKVQSIAAQSPEPRKIMGIARLMG